MAGSASAEQPPEVRERPSLPDSRPPQPLGPDTSEDQCSFREREAGAFYSVVTVCVIPFYFFVCTNI